MKFDLRLVQRLAHNTLQKYMAMTLPRLAATPRIRPLPYLLLLSSAHLLLTSCGSDLTAGVSSGGTGTYTSGVVTGYGSIIVNDIRFNTDQSTVNSTEGNTSVLNQIKIGAMVEVEAGDTSVDSKGRTVATATKITLRQELVGPLKVDATSTDQSYSVWGVRLITTPNTLIENCTTLSSTPYARVNGFVNFKERNAYATRIECTSTQPSTYYMVGTIQDIKDNKQRILVNGEWLSLSPALSSASATLINFGKPVRIAFGNSLSGNAWPVQAITELKPSFAATANKRLSIVEGTIDTIIDTKTVAVDGARIDLSAISNLPTLSLGNKIKAEGELQNGILRAKTLRVNDESLITREYKFIGKVSNLNTTAQRFDIKGVTCYYTQQTEFKDINLAGLLLANEVEVIATRDPVTQRFVATKIEYEK